MPQTVLIVEDDANVRDAYARLLEREGFVVTAVGNGLAAFGAVQQEAFGAIVCDVQLPFLEGRGFYHELEENFPTLAQRVVFVTGLAGDDSVRSSLERTGRPVLKKPVEFQELVDAVRRLANRTS